MRITPLLIIAKAVCLALQRTPELNSAWDEAAQEIVIKHSVNLGIAAATPRGLVVPNIKGAAGSICVALAWRSTTWSPPAREGKTTAGATCPAGRSRSPTSACSASTEAPRSSTRVRPGILCVGQIARRPWVVGTGGDGADRAALGDRRSAVSFDHRLADGEQGSTFLANVAGILATRGWRCCSELSGAICVGSAEHADDGNCPAAIINAIDHPVCASSSAVPIGEGRMKLLLDRWGF